MSRYPVTPDGRYFVVRGRLWRCSNPQLSDEERQRLTAVLMAARRAKGIAMRAGDERAGSWPGNKSMLRRSPWVSVGLFGGLMAHRT